MLEVWREGVRILHLDYPFADWAPVVREAPAAAMGLDVEPIRPGARADLILTRARDFTELFARPHATASCCATARRWRLRRITPRSTFWRVSLEPSMTSPPSAA